MVPIAFLITLDVLAQEYALSAISQPLVSLPGRGVAGWVAALLAPSALLLLAPLVLLFPTGYPLSRRWGWVLGLTALAATAFLAWAILNWPFRDVPGTPSPLTPAMDRPGILMNVGWLASFLALGLALVSLAMRFWRNQGDERRQILRLLVPSGLVVAAGWIQ